MKLRNILIAAMSLTVVAGAAGAASAETPWQAHHPRRVEVNHRLANLNHKIRVDRHDGRIGMRKAHFLHARVHKIRVQERRMAALHGGHLTRHEQVKLNREENGARHHIPA
jgi:hypothetical protein